MNVSPGHPEPGDKKFDQKPTEQPANKEGEDTLELPLDLAPRWRLRPA